MKSQIIRVMTMAASREDAQKIADRVVHARYAACAQVEGPVTSTYWWKNTRETAEEWRCTCTTTVAMYVALEEEIRALHSYDEPEILAIPVSHVSSSFAQWVREETGE